MDHEDIIGIIELGDIKIKCLIFKINKNNHSEILSTSITPSDGLQNDIVINLEKASNAIRLSISDAENKAKISLKKINVIFEQPDFLCTKFTKHQKIDGSKIHRHDIEFLLKEAKKQLLLNDKKQSIIHIFNHNYIVDGKFFVEEPIDVYADTLSHEMTFVTVPKNNLKNINQIFNNCDIEIEKLISRTFSLGVNLFKTKDLQFGSILINIEFKKTSLGIFKNLALVHSITLPIGIDHIVNDISKVCSLNTEESKNISEDIDFLFNNIQKPFDNDNYLKNSYFINSNFRKISKDLILKVVQARLNEILQMIKKQLVVPDISINPGINFIITGEGAMLLNLEKYCLDFFGLNMQDNIIKKDGLEKDYASCLGAIKIIKDGWETEAIPEAKNINNKKLSFFAKIFNNM
jgi:cell division protein FtsA